MFCVSTKLYFITVNETLRRLNNVWTCREKACILCKTIECTYFCFRTFHGAFRLTQANWQRRGHEIVLVMLNSSSTCCPYWSYRRPPATFLLNSSIRFVLDCAGIKHFLVLAVLHSSSPDWIALNHHNNKHILQQN